MDKFEVIVVGGGLAGLAAAYSLAKEGVEVLLVERGDYSGAKNVTGGRLYLNPVRGLLPDIWEDAPFERHVVKEKLSLVGESSSVTVELASQAFGKEPHHSCTVLRSKFDRWLSEKVAEAGAIIIAKNRVDGLIIEGGKVSGIRSGEDEIGADVVIATDGALSLMAEKAGLRPRQQPTDYAVGIKEVVELSPQQIEERFNLTGREGAAHSFVGAVTAGLFGGGFLYTNYDSISLGLVVRISDLMEREPGIEAPELFESFKKRPEIQAVIHGGASLEYSAHVIPEAGIGRVLRLFSDGILVAGDAAGFTLNTGLTVRGMEFALASGALAAKAIIAAREKKDYSARSLSVYQDLLKESFVLKDLATFKDAPGFLDNPRLFTLYPQLACDILEKMMFIGDKPKKKLSSTVMDEIRRRVPFPAAGDFFKAFRI